MSRSNALLVGISATFVGVLFANIWLIIAGAVVLTNETIEMQKEDE